MRASQRQLASRSVRLTPPAGQRSTLGPCALVSSVPGKPEFQIISGKLANRSGQRPERIERVRDRKLPGAIAFFAVRVHVRYDPPLSGAQQRILRRQSEQESRETPEQLGAHRLIGVTSGDQAHP